MGGLRGGQLRRPRQPHRHHRREPPGPERRDPPRLEPRRLPQPGRGLRLARHRDRRPRRRGHRRRLRRGRRHQRQAHGHHRQDQEGRRREVGGGPAQRPRQGRPRLRGRHQGARRRPGHHHPGPQAADRRQAAHVFQTGELELPTYEKGGDKVATRKAYGDALAALGLGPGRRRRPRRRGLQLHLLGDLPGGPPRALLRVLHRRAADDRHRGRHAGPRLDALLLDLRRLPDPGLRLHPHGRGQPGPHEHLSAPTPACPSARTARPRWAWRTSPRSGPCTAARSCTRATPTRRPSWWRLMADIAGIAYLRTTRANTEILYGPDETFPIGGSKVLRSSRRRQGHDRRRRHHPARGAQGGRRPGHRRPGRAGHRPLLGQAHRRRHLSPTRLGPPKAGSSPSRTTGPRAASARQSPPPWPRPA